MVEARYGTVRLKLAPTGYLPEPLDGASLCRWADCVGCSTGVPSGNALSTSITNPSSNRQVALAQRRMHAGV